MDYSNAVQNLSNAPGIIIDVLSLQPSTAADGTIYIAIDTKQIFVYTTALNWILVGTGIAGSLTLDDVLANGNTTTREAHFNNLDNQTQTYVSGDYVVVTNGPGDYVEILPDSVVVSNINPDVQTEIKGDSINFSDNKTAFVKSIKNGVFTDNCEFKLSEIAEGKFLVVSITDLSIGDFYATPALPNGHIIFNYNGLQYKIPAEEL
jgi:hypothetical protein